MQQEVGEAVARIASVGDLAAYHLTKFALLTETSTAPSANATASAVMRDCINLRGERKALALGA